MFVLFSMNCYCCCCFFTGSAWLLPSGGLNKGAGSNRKNNNEPRNTDEGTTTMNSCKDRTPSQSQFIKWKFLIVCFLLFLLFLYSFLWFCGCFWDTQQMRNCQVNFLRPAFVAPSSRTSGSHTRQQLRLAVYSRDLPVDMLCLSL